MIRKIKKLFKKQKDVWFGKQNKAQKNEGRKASDEQIKDAARYVSERFSRAITRLSER